MIEVRDLRVAFRTEEGDMVAVDGVTFRMPRCGILALVGESGCGKSVTGYSLLRLIQPPGRICSGSILFRSRDGTEIDIAGLPERSDRLYDLRGGRIAMIFQEPMTALSPVHTVGNQLCEAIELHCAVGRREARRLAVDMLGRVGIPGPEKRIEQYPFELSGGMRQRVVIAMALVSEPEVLIADEPTTALDVTIQAQIMRPLKEIQQGMGLSILLITHDLGVVGQMADDVAVMYMGRIVEHGAIRDIMKTPRHPYTVGLLASLPSLALDKARLPSIPGHVPGLSERPRGCPFHPRCRHAESGRCDVGTPPELENVGPGHEAACVRLGEIGGAGS